MGGKGSGRREKKRTQHTGLLGVVLATDIPARVIGVEQRGGDTMPRACPKCHSEVDWETSDWQGHCRCCGEDWFRLVGEIRFYGHRAPPAYADQADG